MTHRQRAVAGVLACAVAGLGVSACGSTSGTKLKQTTLKFTEKETQDFGFVDNPPKTKLGKHGPEKLSTGDQISFRASLLDDAGKSVGALDAACFITGAGNGRFDQANATCPGTFTVPGGQLFASVGGQPFQTTTRGAITGGTGAYEGATGSFVSVGENDSKDTIHIWVPQK